MDTNLYSAAHFALELENKQDVGLFRSIEGGGIKAQVMTYQGGANYDRWRQLGKPTYEDIKAQVAASMSESFWKWIENFTKNEEVDRRDGAIIAADFNFKERARREFKNAMIKELVFPKLDATDKNAAYINITLAVEEILFLPGSGKKLTQMNGNNAWSSEKLWSCNNFTFSLDDFGDVCGNVSKIDSFTIKQNIIDYHMGGRRAPIKLPSQIDFPQISFYIPEQDSPKFLERFKQRAILGEQRGSSDKKSGELVARDNEQRDLFLLEFFGADICNVQPDKSDSTTEEIKQVKIDLSIEKMTFKYLKPPT